jgi:hypothetical protein
LAKELSNTPYKLECWCGFISKNRLETIVHGTQYEGTHLRYQVDYLDEIRKAHIGETLSAAWINEIISSINRINYELRKLK